MIQTYTFVASAILLSQACWCANLPSTWKGCRYPDKNHEECLKVDTLQAIKDLANGYPSLGVPSLNPLRIDYLAITQGNGPIKINLNLTNYDIYGLPKLVVKDIKNDWKTMRVNFSFPAVAKSDYKISGQVLVLPINGEGKYELDADLNMEATFHISEKTRKGKQYYHVDKIDCTSNVDRMHIKLDNLFNGNKVLGDQMNLFLNENWKDIYTELSPLMNDATCQQVQGITNRVFSRIPKDVLTPK